MGRWSDTKEKPVPEPIGQLLTRKEAAALLKMSEQTLRCWAVDGKGPPFIKMGTHAVRYRMKDLEEFAAGDVRNRPVKLI